MRDERSRLDGLYIFVSDWHILAEERACLPGQRTDRATAAPKEAQTRAAPASETPRQGQQDCSPSKTARASASTRARTTSETERPWPLEGAKKGGAGGEGGERRPEDHHGAQHRQRRQRGSQRAD